MHKPLQVIFPAVFSKTFQPVDSFPSYAIPFKLSLRHVPYKKPSWKWPFFFFAVFTRTFCDDDIALMSCPSDQQLVLHERAFYGRMNPSEFCPTTNNITCTSDVSFYELDGFCSGTTCTISPVSYSTLKKKECKYSSNYLTLSQSCQGSEYWSVYTSVEL